MNEFEFFSKIVDAARLYKLALANKLKSEKESGFLKPDADEWYLGDTTGQAARAANEAFGFEVANKYATAWDDPMAHVVMVVANRATYNEHHDYLKGLEDELLVAYDLVVAAKAKATT